MATLCVRRWIIGSKLPATARRQRLKSIRIELGSLTVMDVDETSENLGSKNRFITKTHINNPKQLRAVWDELVKLDKKKGCLCYVVPLATRSGYRQGTLEVKTEVFITLRDILPN